MTFPPTVSDFKTYFAREFLYGSGGDAVKDGDIARALGECHVFFNAALLSTVADQAVGYLYLAAHLLVLNIQSAGGLSAVPRGQGVRNQAEQVVVSKGAGQLTVTFQVPPTRIADNPSFLFLFRTDFGQRYLAMVEPATVGPFDVALGPTPDLMMSE